MCPLPSKRLSYCSLYYCMYMTLTCVHVGCTTSCGARGKTHTYLYITSNPCGQARTHTDTQQHAQSAVTSSTPISHIHPMSNSSTNVYPLGITLLSCRYMELRDLHGFPLFHTMTRLMECQWVTCTVCFLGFVG